ncbi:histidine kinase [Arthrobacter sp. PAMC 25486]|uniref:sensor histidine kinase n=1 Tax=Arthrobacter sp. PAMC 25486 TaxID=1494608 RepID=UPI0005361201|nr:ATP-binding protein [Arthrobacter sp. PAMC 25486]AIX99643.1 histidine kinase [Arthrobacter sp. PAMC 25486]
MPSAALLLGIESPPAGRPGCAVPGRKSSTPATRPRRAGGRSAPPASKTLESLALPDSLRELLRSGRTATDEVHLAGDRLLVVSQRPARARGSSTAAGTVVTLRDQTELTRLAGSLSSTETLVEALRSQTHEHANRLHAIISLIELGRPGEALEFAAADHAATVALGAEYVSTLNEPYLAALLLGKAAQADERGVKLEISGAGMLPPDTLDARELVTLLGNLVDNALEAAASHTSSPTVWVDLLVADGALTITVADNGPGLPTTDLDVLDRIGTTGKESVAPGGRGYGIALIRRATAALGGTVTGENDGGALMTAIVPLHHGPQPQRQDEA